MVCGAKAFEIEIQEEVGEEKEKDKDQNTSKKDCKKKMC